MTWLLFAAALDPRIQAAVCDRGLEWFDLPQGAGAVTDRSLALLSQLDTMKKAAA